MKKTVPEPNAMLLDAEDVHQDVVSLTEALERRRAERRTYEIFEGVVKITLLWYNI